MWIMILFFIGIAWMFIGLIPENRPGFPRVRTAREEALHNQVQDAMNWQPEFFEEQPDGTYENAYGQKGVCYTLEEMIELSKREEK